MPKKQKPETNKGWQKEIKDRLPVLKFIGAFIIFTIVFYLATNAAWFDNVRTPLISMYTGLSSFFLNIFGMGTSANGSILTSADFSVNVKEGCDAVVPTLLFVTAVLVFPTAWKYKLRGILEGVAILTVLNLIRIISLFLTGIYAPDFFDFMHVEFWQAVFIILTVLTFIRWLRSTNLTTAHETE